MPPKNRNTFATMLEHTPLPRMDERPVIGRRRMRPWHIAVAIVVVMLTVVVGLVATPSNASPTLDASSANAITAEPVAARTPDMGPESGPQLTVEAWNRAIGTAAVLVGETKLGAPYVYSAGGPNAFDCSGFVRWVWLQLGVTLPHNSVAMWNMIDRIPMSELRPGDLVFDSLGGPPEHVSIYAGDGMMIHAPNGGGRVRFDPVGWWTGARVAAGRIAL